MQRSLIAASVMASILVGCNDAETAKSAVDTTVELSGMFPTDMMVASPMQKQSASKLSDGASYSEAVEAIENAGESLSSFGSRFDPAYFFGDVVDATCFGPPVKYENHPDSVGGTQDGELPSGDVGIWLETNGTKNEACAAAEANAQLKGAASRVFMSLVSFAGLVGNAVADGGLPNRGSSKDLTSRMDSRGLSNVDFTSVTLEQTSSGVWKYNIDLEYVNPTPVSEHMKDASDEDSDGNTTESVNQRIVLAMEHHPGSSSSQFEGVINYRMDDYFNPSGNCQSIQDASGGAKITHNGSLHYKRSGDTITLQHRFAGLCGFDQNELSESITGMSLNHVSATGSWKNNYTVLTASFDKDDMSGSFAYTWQAGDNDRAARILLVDVDPVSGELQNAKGFYGYGNQVQTTLATDSTDKSAAITGFYCNWAGPGNKNTGADYAQYQAMSYNSTKGVFEATSSDITYAPVNSCYYEGTPAGFQYDVDADGTLDTDTASLYVYQSSSSTGYTSGAKVLDLMTKGSSADLMSAIQAKGFTSPTYPAP